MPVASKFLNGVDVSRMQETIQAVGVTPKLGKFTFRVANQWVDGAENRTETRDFNAGGKEEKHFSNFTLVADEHEICSAKTLEQIRSSTCCTRSRLVSRPRWS